MSKNGPKSQRSDGRGQKSDQPKLKRLKTLQPLKPAVEIRQPPDTLVGVAACAGNAGPSMRALWHEPQGLSSPRRGIIKCGMQNAECRMKEGNRMRQRGTLTEKQPAEKCEPDFTTTKHTKRGMNRGW